MARDDSPKVQRAAAYAVHNLQAPLAPPYAPGKKEGKKGKKKK